MYSAFTIIVFMFTNELCVALDAPNPNSTQTKAHILPPCQACKTLVSSFKEVSKQTSSFLSHMSRNRIYNFFILLITLLFVALSIFKGDDQNCQRKV